MLSPSVGRIARGNRISGSSEKAVPFRDHNSLPPRRAVVEAAEAEAGAVVLRVLQQRGRTLRPQTLKMPQAVVAVVVAEEAGVVVELLAPEPPQIMRKTRRAVVEAVAEAAEVAARYRFRWPALPLHVGEAGHLLMCLWAMAWSTSSAMRPCCGTLGLMVRWS